MMPRYTYHCEKCDNLFEYYHGMSEKKTECEVCKEQTLLKLPHFSGTIKKQSNQKVGSIVESYIEEAREEIKKEKDELKNKEYKIK
jgi:putative FmdB family regulatory protein